MLQIALRGNDLMLRDKFLLLIFDGKIADSDVDKQRAKEQSIGARSVVFENLMHSVCDNDPSDHLHHLCILPQY